MNENERTRIASTCFPSSVEVRHVDVEACRCLTV